MSLGTVRYPDENLNDDPDYLEPRITGSQKSSTETDILPAQKPIQKPRVIRAWDRKNTSKAPVFSPCTGALEVSRKVLE